MKQSLIHVHKLTRGYPDGAKLFEGFNFDVQTGDFRVLMGKSGTGKTSLIKLIIGQMTPPKDSIFYGDDDVAKYDETDLENYRKKLGIIFQDYKLLDNGSIRENIAYPLQIFGLGESIIQQKVDTILKTIHLHERADTKINQLSAGEKQKVCLARALVHQPECIIADEPTGNLDPEHTQEVADILIEANKNGTTILLITHDVHLIKYLQSHHTIDLDLLK